MVDYHQGIKRKGLFSKTEGTLEGNSSCTRQRQSKGTRRVAKTPEQASKETTKSTKATLGKQGNGN
jgi:hypothetical protein